jgi:hypothetical protein
MQRLEGGTTRIPGALHNKAVTPHPVDAVGSGSTPATELVGC